MKFVTKARVSMAGYTTGRPNEDDRGCYIMVDLVCPSGMEHITTTIMVNKELADRLAVGDQLIVTIEEA